MSQFGGSSHDDDYGYFGRPKPTTGGSQFGGPPAQSPFGAPPSTAPGAGPAFGGNPAFGMPAPQGGNGYPSNTPPIPQRRKPWLRAVLALALAAGALWIGQFVWFMHQASKPIVMPTALGSRPAVDDPRLNQMATETMNSIRAANPGMSIEGALYGTKSDVAIAVVARGRLDIDREWADAGSPVTTKIGKNECATISTSSMSVCLRTSRSLAVEVVVVGGTVEEAAAGVDQMWAAQP